MDEDEELYECVRCGESYHPDEMYEGRCGACEDEVEMNWIRSYY